MLGKRIIEQLTRPVLPRAVQAVQHSRACERADKRSLSNGIARFARAFTGASYGPAAAAAVHSDAPLPMSSGAAALRALTLQRQFRSYACEGVGLTPDVRASTALGPRLHRRSYEASVAVVLRDWCGQSS